MLLGNYAGFLQNHPRFKSDFERLVKYPKLSHDFTALKYRFILVEAIFSSDELPPGQKDTAIDIILQPGGTKRAHLKERLREVLGEKDEAPKPKEGWLHNLKMSSPFSGRSSSLPVSERVPVISRIFQNADAEDQKLSDTEFCSRLQDFVARMPFLDAAIREVSQASQPYLHGFIETQAGAIKDHVISIRERELEAQWQVERRNEEEAELAAVRSEVVEQIKKASEAAQSKCVSITASPCLID